MFIHSKIWTLLTIKLSRSLKSKKYTFQPFYFFPKTLGIKNKAVKSTLDPSTMTLDHWKNRILDHVVITKPVFFTVASWRSRVFWIPRRNSKFEPMMSFCLPCYQCNMSCTFSRNQLKKTFSKLWNSCFKVQFLQICKYFMRIKKSK